MVTIEDVTTAPKSYRSPSASEGGFYDDFDQRQIIESDCAEPFPPEYEYLRKGSRVSHPKFGRGCVVSRGTQRWPETRIEIHFEGLGPKTLKLSIARLELLDE